MSGLDEKGLEAAVQAGNRLYIDANVGFVPTIQTYRTIIRAYLAAATPADVGELVERLLRERKVHLGDIVAVRALLEDVGADAGEAAAILTAQATALERVVRERDEARARLSAKERADETSARLESEAYKALHYSDELARAESAEAKLAEARKVIEAVAYLQQTYAGEISLPSIETVRAARRWIEETN